MSYNLPLLGAGKAADGVSPETFFITLEDGAGTLLKEDTDHLVQEAAP